MQNLYTLSIQEKEGTNLLSSSERASILYHSFFDFPLTVSELIKWKLGNDTSETRTPAVLGRRGYYFVEGNEGSIYKRLLRKRISDKKMLIAEKAAKVISLVPTVKMVAVTGSLAMENAADESDIDLMIVASKRTLWTTRLFTYFVLRIMNYKVRLPNDKNQKDKLCLNMWLDESDLKWSDGRNIYSAHEIAQIRPLVNKDKTYENFLSQNKWILEYWPNSLRMSDRQEAKSGKNLISYFLSPIATLLEKLTYQLQLWHMRSKITREVVTPTRALFHPQDWSEIILSRFSS